MPQNPISASQQNTIGDLQGAMHVNFIICNCLNELLLKTKSISLIGDTTSITTITNNNTITSINNNNYYNNNNNSNNNNTISATTTTNILLLLLL